eukprot:TRINITY_DN2542_c0_g2_i19.p1 TRINITY_DN2542_c0_g2~~TRINITY_DN2542_c0_g2_i19.p1  ORF type:complete len:275 (-),score=12.72 TRINITY_DN2542_c0_g2_i19:111-935(-)
MNWNCSIDLIPAQKQHGIQITLRSSSLSPVSAFKPVEKRPCSPDKSDTASRVSKISHTPSIIRTLQSVDNIDDVIREAKKRGGLITGESLSKVVILWNVRLLSITEKQKLFLNFQKVFDSISHTFLSAVLSAHGFSISFVSYISFLQFAASTSIILNQSLVNYLSVQIHRGSYQGDPISRYLFNITINYLDTLLLHSCKNTGFKVTPRMKIRTLFYYNNTVLIANSDENLVQYLEVLEQFSPLSGLYINRSKCTIFNNCSTQLQSFTSLPFITS